MKTATSIRQELLRSLFRSLILLYAIGAVLIFFIVKEAIERQTDELLRQKLRDFAEDTRVDGRSGRGQGMGTVFHDFFDWEFGQLYDNSGRSLRVSKALHNHSLPFRVVRERGIAIEEITLPDGRPGRVGFLSFHPKTHRRRPPDFRGPNPQMPPVPPPPSGEKVHLSVAIAVDDERLALRILALTLLGTGLLLGAGMFLVVKHQVQKSLRPVEQLVDLTTTIQPDQLSLRLPFDNLPNELQPLVRQFNTLLDRLETAFVRERSFSANIGHELRTPLTELAALLGNARMDLQQETPGESPEEVYHDANEICQHMNRLVEVISSIHQAESGRELVTVSSINPAEILDEVISGLDDEIKATGMKTSVEDLRKTKNITTDPTLVRAVLQNLLANAVNHSKAGSKIECLLRGSDEATEIEISNSPENIQLDDLNHLSEPFWQKDSSRTDQGNFGLGLSLVDKYTQLIEARISYELKDGRFVAILEVPDLADEH